SENIRKAVDWLMETERTRSNGLIGNTTHIGEQGRYMYGHGFGMLFLACVYGDEEDKDRREKLKNVLKRAVKYTGDAQSTGGGWHSPWAREGPDGEEAPVPSPPPRALRPCRNAGTPGPKAITDKARKSLEKPPPANGGVIYSLGRGGMAAVGGERLALTAAA